LFEGSVSGGCVEGAVVTEALDILKSGRPKVMEFGISNTNAWEVGLACGGNIAILVASVKKKNIPILKRLNTVRAARTPLVLATLSGGRGAKQIIRSHPEVVLEVAVDDPGIHIDLDTREDMDAL